MSSLIAHLAAGATAYACRGARTPGGRRDLPLLAACVALAVLPDLDYLLWWGWRWQAEPRVTHSLGFAAFGAGVMWLLLKRWPRAVPRASLPLATTLLAAAASHELLDFLVGVHASPWLWPASAQVFVSPLGLLPSAGRLDVGNVYLWRNLLIELAVLGPAMLGLCAIRRAEPRLTPSVWLALVMLAGVALAWSVTLPR